MGFAGPAAAILSPRRLTDPTRTKPSMAAMPCRRVKTNAKSALGFGAKIKAPGNESNDNEAPVSLGFPEN